jgi:hypothetical protein
MLLRDLDGALVINDVAAWVAHPDAALPSGADKAGHRRLLGAPIEAGAEPASFAAAAQ